MDYRLNVRPKTIKFLEDNMAVYSLTLRASLIAQSVKNPPAMQETWVRFPGSGRSPGE